MSKKFDKLLKLYLEGKPSIEEYDDFFSLVNSNAFDSQLLMKIDESFKQLLFTEPVKFSIKSRKLNIN